MPFICYVATASNGSKWSLYADWKVADLEHPTDAEIEDRGRLIQELEECDQLTFAGELPRNVTVETL